MSLMVADDATNMGRARMSVVWAEPPFECPSARAGEWQEMADKTHSSSSEHMLISQDMLS
jgi:hypothetical protein